MTIDVTDDPSLVQEMAMAGCTGVFIGFESLTGDNLIEARKRTPLPEDYARRVPRGPAPGAGTAVNLRRPKTRLPRICDICG